MAVARVFERKAEVCPNCGAIECFRKGRTGTSVRKKNGDRMTYVICSKCGARAVRIVRMPNLAN